MGKQRRIAVDQRSTAPPEAVWELLADAGSWARWSSFTGSGLERPAPTGDPDGVGAIRRFQRRGTRVTREEVVAFEPPHRFAYRLLSGVDAPDYRAEVTLTRTDDGGTEISWRSQWTSGRFGSGAVTQVALGLFIRRIARQLALAAARQHAQGPASAR